MDPKIGDNKTAGEWFVETKLFTLMNTAVPSCKHGFVFTPLGTPFVAPHGLHVDYANTTPKIEKHLRVYPISMNNSLTPKSSIVVHELANEKTLTCLYRYLDVKTFPNC